MSKERLERCTQENFSNGRAKYAKEEEKLNHYSEYGSAPTNYFKDVNCIGDFWGLLETRDFCLALSSLAKTSYGVGNMRYLYLCRADNMSVRDKLAPFLLTMGMDQACYEVAGVT